MISKVRNRLDVLWALSRDVSGITDIPRWKVALDVVESRLLWGASEDDYRFFRFYLLDRQAKGTYLTGHLNRKLISKYNKKEFIPYSKTKVYSLKRLGVFGKRLDYPQRPRCAEAGALCERKRQGHL